MTPGNRQLDPEGIPAASCRYFPQRSADRQSVKPNVLKITVIPV
jgi:hypothetical protein